MQEVMTRSQLNAGIKALKQQRNDFLKAYIETHPELSYTVVGQLFELLPTQVATIARSIGVQRKRGKKVKTISEQ